MAENRFYEEHDAEQILKLAAAKQGVEGPMTRERLLQTAAELGISPEAVEAAELDYKAVKEKEAETRVHEEEMREFIRVQRSGFFRDLTTYVVVCGFFGGYHLITTGGLGWTIWMIVFWGLSILAHAHSVFDRSSRDFQRAFDKWRNKRQSSDASIADGVHARSRRDRRHEG